MDTLLTSVGSGAVTQAGTTMAGPIWTIIYVILWITIVWTVVWLFLWAINIKKGR